MPMLFFSPVLQCSTASSITRFMKGSKPRRTPDTMRAPFSFTGMRNIFYNCMCWWFANLCHYSLSWWMPYRKISWSLEAVRFGIQAFTIALKFDRHLCRDACQISERCENYITHYITQFRDFPIFGSLRENCRSSAPGWQKWGWTGNMKYFQVLLDWQYFVKTS